MVSAAAGKINIIEREFFVCILNQVSIVCMPLYIRLSIDIMECTCMLDNEIKIWSLH